MPAKASFVVSRARTPSTPLGRPNPMANTPSGSSDKKNRSLRDLLANENSNRSALRGKPVAKDDPWGDADEGPAQSLDQPSDDEREEILRRLRSQQAAVEQRGGRGREEEEPPKRYSLDPDPPAGANANADGGDADKLTAENQELRNIIAELKQCLEESTAQGKGDASSEAREKEYEALL